MEDKFEIKKEIKKTIELRKDKFKTRDILILLEDYIKNLLKIKMTKKFIIDEINEQLKLNIKYQTFTSFLKRQESTKKPIIDKKLSNNNNNNNNIEESSKNNITQNLIDDLLTI